MPEMNEHQILQFIHCRKCVQDVLEGRTQLAPRDYARLEVGWTIKGLQIWCNRCEVNVVHIDFEGHTHPADVTARVSASPQQAQLFSED